MNLRQKGVCFFAGYFLFLSFSLFSPLFTTFHLSDLTIHHFYPFVNPISPPHFYLILNKKKHNKCYYTHLVVKCRFNPIPHSNKNSLKGCVYVDRMWIRRSESSWILDSHLRAAPLVVNNGISLPDQGFRQME